jgi:hypothetical protein
MQINISNFKLEITIELCNFDVLLRVKNKMISDNSTRTFPMPSGEGFMDAYLNISRYFLTLVS